MAFAVIRDLGVSRMCTNLTDVIAICENKDDAIKLADMYDESQVVRISNVTFAMEDEEPVYIHCACCA